MTTKTFTFSLVLLLSWLATWTLGQQTAALVDTERKRSERHIRFQDLQFNGSAERHSGFNLAIGASPTEPRYAIEGITASGQALRISFSEIISLRQIGSEGSTRLLEVERFPDISSTELIESHPDCKQLLTYRRTVRISVRPQSGEPLYWLGSAEENDDIAVVGRFVDMQQGNTMRMRLPVNHVWWAIPSVVNDPLCKASGIEPLAGALSLRP